MADYDWKDLVTRWPRRGRKRLAEDMSALEWLRFKAEEAGKGVLDNLDARAVLRAIRQAEADAVAREREACAELVDRILLQSRPGSPSEGIAREIAASIRARSERADTSEPLHSGGGEEALG